MSAKEEIRVKVSLGDDKVPEKITWNAPGPEGKNQEAKAMLLSFFDKKTRETLRIDLWTKEMQVVEMDRFMYQTLRSLADSYMRATSNQKLAGSLQQFAQFFGEETEIIPRSPKPE